MYDTDTETEVQVEQPKPRVRRSGLGTGTTSLLMIFTLLCLSTLALLSLSTASSDAKIKGRGLSAAQSLVLAEGEAAEMLARLDEVLVENAGIAEESAYQAAVEAALDGGFSMEGDTVTFTVAAWEDRVLITQVRIAPPGAKERYTIIRQTQESTAEWTPDMGGEVWQGF